MASKRAIVPAKHLFNGFQRCFTRSMATEAVQEPPPAATIVLDSAPTQLAEPLEERLSSPPPPPSPRRQEPFRAAVNPFRQKAQCTLYDFPSLEPQSFVSYPDTHLLLPIRKDLLHRAVIFEGDATRQGTASTKWRSEIHGSNRKVRPQKGTGSARLGDKKSPMLKGGGVAFGPRPRDFSTELNRKVYDRAWRTALSFRYKKGELMIVEHQIDVQGIHENSLERYMDDLLRWNNIGNHGDKKHGRSLFLTLERREGLYTALGKGNLYRHAKAIEAEWVDVKDLLEGGRVIVEKAALEHLFEEHESDLKEGDKLASVMPELYEEVEIS